MAEQTLQQLYSPLPQKRRERLVTEGCSFPERGESCQRSGEGRAHGRRSLPSGGLLRPDTVARVGVQGLCSSRTFFLGETAGVTLQGSTQTSRPRVVALDPFPSTFNSLPSRLQTCTRLAPAGRELAVVRAAE